MGCNCGGGQRGSTIAQRTQQSALRAAGSPVGFTKDHPHRIGAPDDLVRRVRVLKAVDVLTAGQAAYVTGKGVNELILSGVLHDITKTEQKRRLWKVNGFTYSDHAEALRVAASLGVKPHEVA